MFYVNLLFDFVLKVTYEVDRADSPSSENTEVKCNKD